MRKVDPQPALPSFGELWAWATSEAAELKPTPPLQLHSEYGDRHLWGKVQTAAARGMPFTESFEKYLDDVLPPAPVVRALWRMRYAPSAGSLTRSMFRIALGVLQGATDPDTLRRRLGLSDFAFTVAALHGLSRLRALTELEHTGTRAA